MAADYLPALPFRLPALGGTILAFSPCEERARAAVLEHLGDWQEGSVWAFVGSRTVQASGDPRPGSVLEADAGGWLRPQSPSGSVRGGAGQRVLCVSPSRGMGQGRKHW